MEAHLPGEYGKEGLMFWHDLATPIIQVAGERIGLELGLYQCRQPIEATPQIGDTGRQPNTRP